AYCARRWCSARRSSVRSRWRWSGTVTALGSWTSEARILQWQRFAEDRMRMLVADDDRVASAILAKTLARWNLAVTVVDDGAAAWRDLEATAEPTLAILDWMMPELEGAEVCRRVRREKPLANMYLMLL